MRWCNWVEPLEGAQGEDKGVFFFRNRNGLGLPPTKLVEKEIETSGGDAMMMVEETK